MIRSTFFKSSLGKTHNQIKNLSSINWDEVDRFEAGLLGFIIIGYVSVMFYAFFVLPFSLFAVVVVATSVIYAIPSIWYAHHKKSFSRISVELAMEHSEEITEITIHPSQISYDLAKMEPYTSVVQ